MAYLRKFLIKFYKEEVIKDVMAISIKLLKWIMPHLTKLKSNIC